MILATSLFEKFVRGHDWTVPGNMRVKFEVRNSILELLAFNAITPLRRDTYIHRHTHIERKQYLHRSLRSLGRDNY